MSGTAPNLVYSPAADAAGTDSFSFKVTNGQQESEEAWVTIEIVPVNDVPIATPQTVVTEEDAAISIRLSGMDPEGSELAYAVVRLPGRGILSGTAPDLVYTPNAHETGIDTFTFRVGDGSVESTEAEVTIEIRPVNDIPEATSRTVRTEEDQPVGIQLVGHDVEGAALTYSVVTKPMRGVLTGVPPDLTYMPDANAFGSDSFTYKVHDDNADSAESIVTIEISPVNDVPIATPQTVVTEEDAAISIRLSGMDPEGS
ncbi:MAG: hypothetical protein RLZ45_3048, partial [Verrucomicrobiota bacterium]